MKITTKLWLGLGALILLSPLGLLLPEHFKAGSAWGEWGVGQIKEMAGFVPKGLEKLAGLWKAPIPDYAFKGCQDGNLARLSLSYIISAIVGIAFIVILILLIGKFLAKKDG
jgi:cobalt/nickel transport protein